MFGLGLGLKIMLGVQVPEFCCAIHIVSLHVTVHFRVNFHAGYKYSILGIFE